MSLEVKARACRLLGLKPGGVGFSSRALGITQAPYTFNPNTKRSRKPGAWVVARLSLV